MRSGRRPASHLTRRSTGLDYASAPRTILPAAENSRVRRMSAEAFSRDIIAHPARYVPASLPGLPFPDGRFDLVLSSHFLFTYADRLDLEFHRAALHELHRVARRKVRVFPLLEQSGRPVPGLLSQLLATLDIPYRIRRVGYEFQRGGNEMLV